MQLKEFKSILDKVSLKSVICFFKIQFDRHIPCPTPSRYNSPNHLLHDDNIIAYVTPRHKPSLTGVDDFFHVGFESVNNDTRQQFIKGIVEANRTKFSDCFKVGYFWNNGQVRVTPTRRESVMCENVLNDLNDAWAQTRPICLEEESMISIQSRGL